MLYTEEEWRYYSAILEPFAQTL